MESGERERDVRASLDMSVTEYGNPLHHQFLAELSYG